MVEGQINSGPDDELATTAKMLLEESDRGCAVFGAQMIDDQLKVFLTTLLNRDDEYDKVLANLLHGYGPLASFSARLDVAYVMGALTSEQYQSIQIVRKIRNRMAHDRGP